MGTNESLAVRRAAAGDAQEMFRLSVEAIRASAAGYYTVPQLEAWAGRRTVETHRQMIEETFALVAVTDEGIVGFATIALEPAGSLVAGEVDQLFVSPSPRRPRSRSTTPFRTRRSGTPEGTS